MKPEHANYSIPGTAGQSRLPRLWLYFVMLLLGVVSALWLHGHPFYTLVIIGITPLCAVAAYLPARWMPLRLRLSIMALFVLGAIGWATLRFMERTPIDKVLIECICALALSFSFSPRRQDFGYMLLISGLLLLYGALLPRNIYLTIVPIAALLSIVILAGSRTNGLSGDYELKPVSPFKYCWGKILLQCIILVGLWVTFYFLFPQEESVHGGIFYTSFKTQNDNVLPPTINTWFRPQQVKMADRGAVLTGKNQRPTSSGQSGKAVQSKSKSGLKSSGNGNAPPGRDLVFIARSPAKLYWVGQLYDRYEGQEWFSTDAMRQQRTLIKRDGALPHLISQDITMTKWISPVLFSAYRADFCNVDTKNADRIEGNFYQYRFKEKMTPPPAPYNYSINSEITPVDAKRKEPLEWQERVRRENYLQLPKKMITPRLEKFTAELTQKHQTDYEKAIAIRDYLRNTFKYKQASAPTPAGREAVDFFVFELKEGHCEYFAAAMTVMARIAKIPARVVTGFSPGNYNVLTKIFEVYEYHGHAWSQLYFEDLGWLTFDATPPGSVESRATPMLIGSLRDPFGDEWRIKPPELTQKTQLSAMPEGGNNLREEDNSILDRMLYETVMLPEKISRAMDSLQEKSEKSKAAKIYKWMTKVGNDFWKDTLRAWKSMQRRYINMFQWLKNHIPATIGLLLAAAVAGPLCGCAAAAIRRNLNRRQSCRLLEEARQRQNDQPTATIHLIYCAVRKMLIACGRPRQRNQDLFDYAIELKRLDPVSGHAALTVFFLYSRTIYGNGSATPAQAAIAVNAAQQLQEQLPELTRRAKLPAADANQTQPPPDSDPSPDRPPVETP